VLAARRAHGRKKLTSDNDRGHNPPRLVMLSRPRISRRSRERNRQVPSPIGGASPKDRLEETRFGLSTDASSAEQ